MGNTNQQIYGLSINRTLEPDINLSAYYTVPEITATTRDVVVASALFHVNGLGFDPEYVPAQIYPICTLYEQGTPGGNAATGFQINVTLLIEDVGRALLVIEGRLGDGTSDFVLSGSYPINASTGIMGRWGVVHLIMAPVKDEEDNVFLYVNGVQVDSNRQDWTLPTTTGTALNSRLGTIVSGPGQSPCRSDLVTLAGVANYVAPAAAEPSNDPGTLFDNVSAFAYVAGQSGAATIAQRSLMAVGQNTPFNLSSQPGAVGLFENGRIPAFQGKWMFRSTDPVVPATFANEGSNDALGEAEFLPDIPIPPGQESTYRSSVQRDVYDSGFFAGDTFTGETTPAATTRSTTD